MALPTATIDIRKYLFVLRRRWELTVLVFLTILAMGIAYCFFWPKIYEATAMVVVQPQKIPGNIVQATVTTKIDERLQIITQQVLSRTRLTELIQRFDLYPKFRGKVPPDELAERMRANVSIKITRQNYFTITFFYQDPKAVAAVTNSIAAFYVDTNLRLREQDAVGTANFLTRELERMRSQLREWEDRITEFKEAHLQELPEAQDKNLTMLQELGRRLETADYYAGVERSRREHLEMSMANIASEIQKIAMTRAHQRATGVAATGGGSDGESDPTAIKKQIERLRVFYTDDHPDIQRLKRHLAKAEAQKEKKVEDMKKQGAPPQEMISEAELEIGSLKDIQTRLAKNLQEAKRKIEEHEKQKVAVAAEIAETKNRIENGPAIAEKLNELTRGYDVLKMAHQKMHGKWLEAKMAANLERTQRGEQFEVMDPAQVPDAPYRPNVRKAIPLALAAALILAVGLSFGLNYLDTSFSSVEQMERMSELPVLVVLPPLITAREAARQHRRLSIIATCYGVVFLVMLGFMGILVTGRAQALKNFVQKLFT